MVDGVLRVDGVPGILGPSLARASCRKLVDACDGNSTPAWWTLDRGSTNQQHTTQGQQGAVQSRLGGPKDH